MKLSSRFGIRTFYLLLSVTVFMKICNTGYNLLSLSQRLGEYEIRIQYINVFRQSHHKEITVLSEYLLNLTEAAGVSSLTRNYINKLRSPFLNNNDIVSTNQSINISKYSILKDLSLDARMILRISALYSMKFPTIFHLPRIHYLPQLLGDPMSLPVSYLLSKNRTGFSMVLGIPTVKRDIESYLIPTLRNLIFNMNYEEQQVTLIVICIGETDMDYVYSTAKQIYDEFTELVDQGLIDILSPSASYYPDFEKIPITLNDTKRQVQWRSKQNLDISFLMAYAHPKAKYYVQLEDDIVAKPIFISTMKRFANIISARYKSWFALEFCRLGFIGKMFKSTTVPWFITYFQIFYNEKPIDWLMYDLYASEICNWTTPNKVHECATPINLAHNKYWFQFKRSLFQHIGKYSSLHNKTQNIEDIFFTSKF